MLLHRKSVMRTWGIRRLVSKQPYTDELLKMAEFQGNNLVVTEQEELGVTEKMKPQLAMGVLVQMKWTYTDTFAFLILGMSQENLQCKPSQKNHPSSSDVHSFFQNVSYWQAEQGDRVVWFQLLMQRSAKCFQKHLILLVETVQSNASAN